jgi:Carbohydrate-selective porin, OprB family
MCLRLCLRFAGIVVAIFATVPLSVRAEPLQSATANRRSVETQVTAPKSPKPAIDPTPLVAQTTPARSTDIKPTDWAFQTLTNLALRYKCPSNPARYDRPITREEFARDLQVCIIKAQTTIAQTTLPPTPLAPTPASSDDAVPNTTSSDAVTKADLENITRLQAEFATELVALALRVGELETRTTKLASQQFSPNTKLSGQLVTAFTTGGFGGNRIVDGKGATIATRNPQATALYRVFLDLNTSFSGKDLLKVRLWSGSDGANDNAAGLLEPNFGSVLDYSARSGINDQFSVARAYYSFVPTQDLRVSLGLVMSPIDYVDKNSYANKSFVDFSTQAFVNNFVLMPINGLGAGAAVEWNPAESPFTVRAVYVAADAFTADGTPRQLGVLSSGIRFATTPTTGQRGIFGDPYQGIVEVEYAPSKTSAVRLQYSGGNVFSSRYSVFGANMEWLVSKDIALFGRFGTGSYLDTSFGNINPTYWMAGVAFPDLFVKNGMGGIAIGQPFIAKEIGNSTQTNIEAFYNFPVSDTVRITPAIQVITGAGNQSSNGTITTGTLRGVFSF